MVLAKLVDSEATQNAGLPGTQAYPQSFDSREIPCLLLGHPDIEYRWVTLYCHCYTSCTFVIIIVTHLSNKKFIY